MTGGSDGLEELELTQMAEIEFPYMRLDVMAALQGLSDPEYQKLRWGVWQEGQRSYDDFTMTVHILYDDCCVLPNPETAIGSMICPREVEALRAVHEVLGPLINRLGARPDEVYLHDSSWKHVVSAAQNAVHVMLETEAEHRGRL